MQAVILAAGRGKRLHPITFQRSKAMLPVLGQPIISRIVESIASNGVSDFIIVTSPDDEQLTTYFQDNPLSEINIRFVEQKEPRGMAHALLCAKDWIIGDFLLTACDSLIPQSSLTRMIASWYAQPHAGALLALMLVSPDKMGQTAVVQIESDRITTIIEKPALQQTVSNIASLPIYIFRPGILDILPQIKPSSRGEYELQDAIQSLIDQGEIVRGVLIEERLNLTSAKDLLEVNLHLLQIEKPQFIADSVTIAKNVLLYPPYWIGPYSTIGEQCSIGPNVFIESDCHIDHHCQMINTLILKGSRLAPYQDLNLEIIYG
jgi:dTDP-glucose pyrophosphorylase